MVTPRIKLVFIVILMCLSSILSADIIVLRMDDTQQGITTDTPLLNDSPVNDVPPPGDNDEQWGFAADISNGQSQMGNASAETAHLFNYVWVSRADLGENCTQLTTTVSGLDDAKAYNLYLYQVTSDSDIWGLQAGLSGGSLVAYLRGSGATLEESSASNFERVLIASECIPQSGELEIVIDDHTSRGFIKGIGVEEVVVAPRLTLEVDTSTGCVAIKGNAVAHIENIDLYEITSGDGALNPYNWFPLQDANLPGFPAGDGTGNGWEILGTPDANFLGEAFLDGSNTFAADSSTAIGNAFTIDGTEDLSFRYHTTGGQMYDGLVEYYISGASGGPGHYKVLLLAGQSNMRGQGVISDLPSDLQGQQTDVVFYTDDEVLKHLEPSGRSATEFGPEVLLGRTAADTNPNCNFLLIKYAVGGTDLKYEWDPATGPIYADFRDIVTGGLDALMAGGHTYEITGFFWMQGEADAVDGYAGEYAANLTNFIADVRTRYGADLPFVFGQLSANQTAISAGDLSDLRAMQAQVDASVAGTAMVLTDSFGIKTDNLHFNSVGQMDMGEAFAHAYRAFYPLSDFDCNGTINLSDFTVLAESWYLSGGEYFVDIAPFPNGDEVVDLQDISVLSSEWLE